MGSIAPSRSAPQGTPQATRHAGFLIIGALIQAIALRQAPGSAPFLLASGALGLWWLLATLTTSQARPALSTERRWRATLCGLAIGLGLAACFLAGAFLMQHFPALRAPAAQLVTESHGEHVAALTAILLFAGATEELYFRGALFHFLHSCRHPIVWSTLAYTAVVATSGVVLLTFSAFALGLVTALVRRAIDRIEACIMVHLSWSLTMFYALPLIFTIHG